MRRTAVLFDVHGNLAALDAVLAAIDAEGLDGVVCGGDLALYGPHPAGAVDRLRERGIPCVQGNTDRYLATGPAGGHAIWSEGMPGAWTADRLGPERLAWLGGLPTRLEPLPGVLVVHATPRSDEEELVPETPDADVAEMLAPAGDARVVLGGHMHVQFRRAVRGRTFANPGSVGLPFDGDRRAAWAVVDADGTVDLRRTAYDVERAIANAQASGSPVAATVVRRLTDARA